MLPPSHAPQHVQVHPDYSSSVPTNDDFRKSLLGLLSITVNDIAMLTLARPSSYQPAKLARRLPFVGATLTAVGMGKTEDQADAKVLMEAPMSFEDGYCPKPGSKNFPSVVCASGLDATSTDEWMFTGICHGDSGGPLYDGTDPSVPVVSRWLYGDHWWECLHLL